MRRINHLYWRAGFGLSPQEWEEKKNWSVGRAVDSLFREAGVFPTIEASGQPIADPLMLDKEELVEKRKEERRMVFLQNVDWLKRMASPENPALLERMSLFWHGHFACRTLQSKLAAAQLNTIRQHALGNFRDLTLAIARDVSMIRYLNNQQNRKDSPNENFARELMELFTIGRGHYTEEDIKEAARAFTGWSSNLQGEFVFRTFQHDYGKKTFFGKSGNFNGEDIIDIILEKRETADYITRKIYRYFVHEQVDPDIVAELSRSFYRSGYDIAHLMRTIFESDWFYDPKLIGAKIKSPVELMAGMMRSLHVRFDNDLALIFVQKALGQTLFDPPNVAGWPGGKSWIDNSTLMLRLNLASYLMTSSEVNLRPKDQPEEPESGKPVRKLMASVDLVPLKNLLRGKSAEETLKELTAYLLLQSPKVEPSLIRQYAFSKDDDQFLSMAAMRLMSLPEYQMC